MDVFRLIHLHGADKSCESNRDLGWCFWDETGDCHGPFESHQEAARVFESYCRWLETGEQIE